MKISKLFHWLYFTVMMLPLFVVPIYFIYSQRHDLTQQTQVDIQYKYQSNEVNTNNDLIVGNIYLLQLNNITADTFLSSSDFIVFNVLEVSTYDFSNYTDDINIDEFIGSGNNTMNSTRNELYIGGNSLYLNSYMNGVTDYFVSIYMGDPTEYNFSLDCICLINEYEFTFDVYQYFSYTDYNVIESVRVEDTNSSITNVFVNSFADTIDKYFNYDQVVNFSSLYGWLNSTFFNNQAPLGFFIFWHLLEYWLLTSLLWLLFDVLLYVPNLIHRWLDKASLS